MEEMNKIKTIIMNMNQTDLLSKFGLRTETAGDKVVYSDGRSVESDARNLSRFLEEDVEIWHLPDYDRPRRLCTIKYKKK